MPRKTLETLVKETKWVYKHRDKLQIRWIDPLVSSTYPRAKNVKRPIMSDGKEATDKQWVDHAKDLQKEYEKKAKQGTVTLADTSITLAEVIEMYIEKVIWDARKKGRYQTKLRYEQKCRSIQKWPIAQSPISKINFDSLDNVMRKFAENHKNGYALKIHNRIKDIFNFAVMKNLISYNVMTTVMAPQVEETAIRKVDPSITEYLRKQSENYDPPYQAIIWIASWCGLRLGELSALKWNALNIEGFNTTLEVRGQITITENGLERVPWTKSSSGLRTLPIPDVLAEWLLAYRAWQQEEFGEKWNSNLYVFADENNPFKTPGVIQDFIKILGEETRNVEVYADDFIDCPNIDVTFIRHAYCCLMLEMGVKLTAVARYMGHKNIKILYKYANLVGNDYSEDRQIMNSFITDDKTNDISTKVRQDIRQRLGETLYKTANS